MGSPAPITAEVSIRAAVIQCCGAEAITQLVLGGVNQSNDAMERTHRQWAGFGGVRGSFQGKGGRLTGFGERLGANSGWADGVW